MNRRMVYFSLICFFMSFLIIGATYAYFMAKASNNDVVYGDASVVTFGLRVEKITTADMAFGLVPMMNDQAPFAAGSMCHDVYGNAGCQLYRVTVTADSDTVMFLDGYVHINPKDGVETRVSSVYTNDDEQSFHTAYTLQDFSDRVHLNEAFLSSNAVDDQGIKSGMCDVDDDMLFSREEDNDCFLISNKKIGGDEGRSRMFYIMVWVYDDGMAQDFMQGMELAYQGSVTFVTAQGNEITATFD